MAGQIDSYSGGFPTTGSIRQALALQGVTAPHTGKPYSEAFLMGLAGGAAFGYFIFSYSGHDPQVNLLTRNTFSNYGWDTIVERLRMAQDVVHSTSADRARAKLVEALESGSVPIAWVDVFTLGYEYSEFGDGMWAAQPVVVMSYDHGGETTLLDRSAKPFSVSSELFDNARSRVKKDRFRLATVESPAVDDEAAVIAAGLADCVALYYEKPPRGSASNFGRRAYDRWLADLTKPDSKSGWLNRMPNGRSLFAGLSSAYRYGLLYWKDESLTADRALFADCLSEVSRIIPGLETVQTAFRESAAAWRSLGKCLLPDDIGNLRRAKELLEARHSAFLNGRDVADLRTIDREFNSLREKAESAFSDSEHAKRLLAELAGGVERLRDAENLAFAALKSALDT